VARGTKTRFTFSPEGEYLPRWSPDGRDIAFVGVNENWMMKAADGIGPVRDMGEGRSLSFAPDGKAIVLTRIGKDTKTLNDLWYVPLDGQGQPRPLLRTPAIERVPAVSPDGRYLAYVSNEPGRFEVYLTRFPSGEGKWQVSVDGGQNVHWNPKGKELFFTNEDALYCVDVQIEPELMVGTPRKLFDGDKIGIPIWRDYDVAQDGQRLLVIENERQRQSIPSIVVVENWFEEFRKR
jgi:serine/threonine-protein kinase